MNISFFAVFVGLIMCTVALDKMATKENNSGNCGSYVDWSFDESTGTFTISGFRVVKDCNISSIKDKIKSIVIEEGPMAIGTSAFQGCTNLKSVIIPQSVKDIQSGLFAGCTSLESIKVIGGNFKVVDNVLFDKAGTRLLQYACGREKTDYSMPDDVTYIENNAFGGCTRLTSVTFSKSLSYIGTSAFRNCTGLSSLAIPDSLSCLYDSSFEGCTGLTMVVLPNNEARVLDYAFKGCTNLKNLIIPTRISYIGFSAFEGCTSLISVTLPNITELERLTFEGCTSLTSVTIGPSVEVISDESFKGCTSLSTITVDPNSQYFKAVDNVLFDKKGETLIQYACGKKETEYSIPESVESFGEYAFDGCTNLATLKFPKSVKSVKPSTFRGCNNLDTITVDENNQYFKATDNVLFDKEEKELVKFACGKRTEYTVQKSVTNIGYYAFMGCKNIESIKIKGTIDTIYSGAFMGCSNLKNLEYDGDQLTGYNINIFDGCDNLQCVKCSRYYFSETFGPKPRCNHTESSAIRDVLSPLMILFMIILVCFL